MTTVTGTTGEPRPHQSIGEVLALLQPEFPDVTISKIRFLESQGLLDPERTPSGYRKFYEQDLARLRWILTQQRDHFLPLRVIKDRLAAEPIGAPSERTDLPASVGATAEAVVASAAPATAAMATATATATATGVDEPSRPADSDIPAPIDRAALAEALARRAAQRSEDEAPAASGHNVLDAGHSDLSLTTAELAAAAGIAEREVERLASFGLIEGRTIGREVIFDGDALVIARLAAAFIERGLEPRHLRMFKVAAEREAGVYEQLVRPLTRQRDPQSRARTEASLGELADLGHQLRAALLRGAVRDLIGR